jgi:hypothetical protein
MQVSENLPASRPPIKRIDFLQKSIQHHAQGGVTSKGSVQASPPGTATRALMQSETVPFRTPQMSSSGALFFVKRAVLSRTTEKCQNHWRWLNAKQMSVPRVEAYIPLNPDCIFLEFHARLFLSEIGM